MFTKLDRLARNLRDLLNVWSLLQEDLGLDLVCIDDSTVNTKGKLGKVILTILGCFAEFERDTIKERTDGGRKIKWQRGQAFIGQPPFGYRWNTEKKRLEIVPDEQKTYNRIVSMYLDQNYPMSEIANRLSADGVPPPSSNGRGSTPAKRWNKVTVSKMLRNSAYKGEAFHNRFHYEWKRSPHSGRQHIRHGKKEKPREEWVSIQFPAMISEDRWNEIQEKREFNKFKPRKKHQGYEDRFISENVLWCGECGGKIRKRIKTDRNGKLSFYYVCYWKRTTARDLEAHGR